MTRWRQVTLERARTGEQRACWVPELAADTVGELVDIEGEAYTIRELYPPVDAPDNNRPQYPTAHVWGIHS
jgi:hypothetical protein